ncbi:hypothetical protein [Methylocella silvestris]|uniref:hypothetical protein n=1 Tax=Methylocella silvestris TaxID=199596 RepID=UPI0015E0D5AB|nr:hypothetical protein [Methylocella silvestris]
MNLALNFLKTAVTITQLLPFRQAPAKKPPPRSIWLRHFSRLRFQFKARALRSPGFPLLPAAVRGVKAKMKKSTWI